MARVDSNWQGLACLRRYHVHVILKEVRALKKRMRTQQRDAPWSLKPRVFCHVRAGGGSP